MLFVDDDEAEVVEVDLVFDEGVGADGEVDFAAEDAGAGIALGAVVERAGEQGDAVGPGGAGREFIGQQAARREIVLCGEDLGGGHEGDLVAVLDGDERGLEGDDGLAGADVALQQAAHGLGAAHVGDDLAEHAFLRGGGFEGEHLFEGGADGVVGGEGDAGALAQTAALEFEAELEVEELLEDEAAVRGSARGDELGHGGACGGEVQLLEGLHAGGEGEAVAEGVGSVSGAGVVESASSRKTVHMTRRCQREVSLAPHGVLPPSDS